MTIRDLLSKLRGHTVQEAEHNDAVKRPVTPVTRERVAHVLTAAGYQHTRDSDGDIVGVWDGNTVWFLLLGPEETFLQVRSRWQRAIGPQGMDAALLAVSDWNRDHLWPKVFLREEGPQSWAAYTETTHDFCDGATSDQLDYYLHVALQTTAQFYDHMARTVLPDNPENDTDPPQT
ncbi:YbjN domain-containing protein [Jonesia denitrificans]|uniref:Sensory transduction regulator n=1 Tax=Jonesia denitrificans (strain ATCC 14870 / DSM 20603 / BCRC 15368 / CIP 55.134 / JCM 11481 / NBRC 15587 / NCTC 10816 / Prevot 55134) TaxID=471856 RepID=C7R3G5_JONDD|nr:YbjN domain-containing protein [Jonesia denitrificans]ACV08701.1 hypothetical protein Jden_1045 [Jonesia denitrificans DSM 20603]ASE09967.1 YbjN domain-containing protein [Jonesia denitrificans]QXB42303.1 YbjN domain-containing protein [Jonesia denitrificans]SQH20690.1 Uncharacterised protein [Jonesia denitrificans]